VTYSETNLDIVGWQLYQYLTGETPPNAKVTIGQMNSEKTPLGVTAEDAAARYVKTVNQLKGKRKSRVEVTAKLNRHVSNCDLGLMTFLPSIYENLLQKSTVESGVFMDER